MARYNGKGVYISIFEIVDSGVATGAMVLSRCDKCDKATMDPYAGGEETLDVLTELLYIRNSTFECECGFRVEL